MRPLHRIVIHHSASPRSTTAADIDGWHRAKRWDGVGYHFVVEGLGDIVRGRPIDKVGAHAKGANEDSIGICVVGDNTNPEEHWSREQCHALTRLVFSLRQVFGPLPVLRHRDVGTTATKCPGIDDAEWHAVTMAMRLDGQMPVMGE